MLPHQVAPVWRGTASQRVRLDIWAFVALEAVENRGWITVFPASPPHLRSADCNDVGRARPALLGSAVVMDFVDTRAGLGPPTMLNPPGADHSHSLTRVLSNPEMSLNGGISEPDQAAGLWALLMERNS